MKKILAQVLGRETSMFLPDLERLKGSLSDSIKGSSILIIGAAGSIGRAFVKEVLTYGPSTIHLIDISENGLVELVRDIRSTTVSIPDDFKTYAIALGQPEFDCFLNSGKGYDYIANFSAMKHVRSERDPYSLMRLVHTNALINIGLINGAKEKGVKKLFSVSSDKAVNPCSAMGASKRLMELIYLNYASEMPFGSARFANVAFSDGSLLDGFRYRIAKKQPIVAPNDVRRYFISEQEAAQLCVIGLFIGENGDIVYPKLDPESDLITFSDIAEMFLKERGLTPIYCENEEQAREISLNIKDGTWPCLFTGSNTTGEKMFEEFWHEADLRNDESYEAMGFISHPIKEADKVFENLIEAFSTLRNQGSFQKSEIIKLLQASVPTFSHTELGQDLDQKM